MVSLSRTQHGEEAGVRWEAARANPDARLAGLVTGYGGFFEAAPWPVIREELPAARLVLLLSLGEPLCLSRSGEGSGPTRAQAALIGVSRTGVVATHSGSQRVLEVELSPLAAMAVFDVTAAELTGQIVELAELWSHTSQLLDQLRAVVSWADRFQLIEAAVTARTDEGPGLNPVLAGAWREIVDSRGYLGMQVLREQTGWSRKRLAENFRAEVGLPPKAMSGLARFQHAVDLLRRPGRRSLAAVALTCGYYDQAHFNREFRELAGCTPTEFLISQDIDVAGTAMAGN
ncbi:helix-turn-helix domain-containing protein [Mycobacterium sp. NPDC004974]